MAVAAETLETPRVEARGVGLRAGLVAVGFLLVALVIGLSVGPVPIGLGAILRYNELDAGSSRRVLEPRLPQWPRVGEHEVEVECEQKAGHDGRW